MSNDDWVVLTDEGSNDFEMHDFEQDPLLMGKYVSVKRNIGNNGSNIYQIITADGEKKEFWGSSVIDQRFPEIETGSMVRVEFNGLKKSTKTGRSYKDFSIAVKR
jgi:hypothetical protein